ncbi:similar to aerobic respiration control sensor protein arcB [Plenodomus lingam JN3]|uniref:Similar to aerobic respiration control sensor protein arcB n=1 Tax=Leptosphaeria maculans (strain JN3 / isolate v23.1.3 / race Av1-4-5-6-7-8) TaxID=985895 RepID=E5ABV6_LEPMJ|nr:similar to aerobic respiration control sensor protein arcB [Plenodomus lingam JN3]CBY01147.1 similar to aerobic respiration control sensor protein arcB [Plenodomus lingam JN3]
MAPPLDMTLRFSRSQNEMKSLQAVGILDYLEQDSRPTFIIDTESAVYNLQGMVIPSYTNPAMANIDSGSLLNAPVRPSALDAQEEIDMDFSQFRKWVFNTKSSTQPFTYRDFNWLIFCVANRWSVISGTPLNSARLDNSINIERRVLERTTSRSKIPTFDWTDELPPLRLSAHASWARSIDWAATSLGPMSSWSAQLRSIANLVMQDPRPAVVFYGPDLIMIYNEAEIELLGGFHPCMGKSARVALAPVWPEYFEPIIQKNLEGETVEQTNTAIHMVRSGFLEETYFSLKFIPILDADGATVGHYEPLVETTRNVIAQRRSRTLLEISEELPRARNSESYWPLAVEVLSRNDKDIPFALLYAAEAESSSSSASSWTRFSDTQQQCRLRGSFGLPLGSLAGPAHLDFRQDYGFSPYFREAMVARKPITISLQPGSPAAELVKGIQWQGFGDPCREAAICPLNPTSSTDNILGFMVIGLNPRRPYDDDYLQFILVTSRLLSTSLTSILLHEEDLGRRERTIANAEAMKQELRQQLLESQNELERSLTKFQRFAERADIGIFILDMEGIYTYRNKAWYDICSPGDRDVDLEEAWSLIVDSEYHEMGQAKFAAVVEEKKHQTWTVTGKNLDDSLSNQQPMWVICSIFPELNEEGAVIEIIGCITDIRCAIYPSHFVYAHTMFSQQKWSEKLQETQALDSQESKRQLENFIDTTSHEMRNPLSAILQCADSIIASHRDCKDSTGYQHIYRKIVESTVESAETIVQCSKHMKTIVDDVLTMSKLDSGLFVMTPTVVQLDSIARDAVRMFEGEAKAADVDLKFRLEDSFKSVNVNDVSLDPTRVLQILINLITNAIKFTRLEDKRKINISLGLSLQTPLYNADGHVQFIRSAETAEAQALQADWEKGEVASDIHVIFTVQDTGRGLSAAEHELMFARFSQASPRTHIDYGGSGLGLFISRRLTEMHGGAIGFASTKGVGSTFSFYIKGRKIRLRSPTGERNTAVDMSLRTQSTILDNSRTRNAKDEPSHPQTPTAHTTTTPQVPAQALHILVVEDNLVNQRVLAKQLRNLGMHVTVANHGAEALAHLRTTRYCADDTSAANLSLILMDWEMPVMDGLTCVRHIRQLEIEGVVRGHVPVIAVTANVRSEQVEVALKAGMDNLISKPFRIPELCACMQKTLEGIGG